jgi:hypothetical protein
MRGALIVIMISCVATLAAAQQPSKQFLDEYQKGVDAYNLGKYDEAKAHLEAAKAIDVKLPGPWRYLALVAQGQSDWAACVADAREALRLNPQSKEVLTTRKIHDDCRGQQGKPAFDGPYDLGQGALAVVSDQAGASVTVNGLAYGATPMAPRALVTGDVEVAISKTGYLTATQKVTILEGIVTDVEMMMLPDPAAQHLDTTVHATPTVGWIVVASNVTGAVVTIDGAPGKLDAQGRYEVEQGSHHVEITAPSHEGHVQDVRVTSGQLIQVKADLRDLDALVKKRKTGHLLVGGGLGALAIGAVTAWISLDAANQARDEWRIETTRPIGTDTSSFQPLHTRADVDALSSRSRTFAIVSDVSYGVAAVAIAVGAYYLIKARPALEVRW